METLIDTLLYIVIIGTVFAVIGVLLYGLSCMSRKIKYINARIIWCHICKHRHKGIKKATLLWGRKSGNKISSPTVYQIGGKSQMFKVTMTNLGCEHANEMRSFENEPDGGDLYNMAAKHLLSSNIWFSVHSGSPDKNIYPVIGTVCAGAHQVGKFKVEKTKQMGGDGVC